MFKLTRPIHPGTIKLLERNTNARRTASLEEDQKIGIICD